MLVVEVQCCQNCERHNWCSRHNEAKYQQFSSHLQTRLQPLLPHLSFKQNLPPPHFTKKTLFSNLGLPVQSYYDELKKQIAIFPRHGAFQITVNGILIFSKLQSNIWPNIERIALLIAEIKAEIECGGDIKKYSIDYRLNSLLEDKERGNTKQKKSVKFKISKRPKSNEFNSSGGAMKASHDETLEGSNQKKRNKDTLSKQKLKPQRQSEIGKKSLIKLKIKKNQSAHSINNQQSTHSINNNQEILKIDQQFTHFTRKIEGNQSSLMLNKRIQQKNQIFRQVKSQQLKSMANKGFIKLQKKSRKLVIQSNKPNLKKEEVIISHNQKVEQSEINGQQILFFKTPLKLEQHQEKSLYQQYQHQSYNKPKFQANLLEVQDYQSQKQINAASTQKMMDELMESKEVEEVEEGEEFSNKNIDIIYIEDDNTDYYFIQIESVKEYWQRMVEDIVQSTQLKSLKPIQPIKPIEQFTLEVYEGQQAQLFERYSQKVINQHKIQECMPQQSIPSQKENSENKIEYPAQTFQQLQQISNDPFTPICDFEQQKSQIQQDQQYIKQCDSQRSNHQLNTPPNLIKQDNLTQQSQQLHDFSSSPHPLQQFQQIAASNAPEQKIPQNNFTLDEIIPYDHSKSIQQAIIKEQSKQFQQKLTNNILENTRLFNEDSIKEVIQTLQQRQQSKFTLSQQINNSEDNIGIAFQLTKEQGFFQGKKETPAKPSFLELKQLEEKNKQEELQYSVYSEDPQERFIEGRTSKLNSLKALEMAAGKIEEGHHSNQTIIEAESSIVDPTTAIQPEESDPNQPISPETSPPEQGNEIISLEEGNQSLPEQASQQIIPASSAELEMALEEQQNSFTTNIELQQQKEDPVLFDDNLELQTERAKQPLIPIATQNKESSRQKSLKCLKSLAQKQNQPPSLKCLSSIEDTKVNQGERVLTNITETSISLSSQIRSQLNCLYYDIQARI